MSALQADSLEHWEKVIETTHDPKEKADALQKARELLPEYEAHERKLEMDKQALQLYEQIGDKQGIASTLFNTADAYNDLSENSKALDFFNRALVVYEELGDKKRIADTFNNIGRIYYEQNKYEQALANHEKALKLRREIGYKFGVGASFGNIANVFFVLGNYAESLNYSEMALQVFSQLNDPLNSAHIYNQVGGTLMAQGKFVKALENLHKSAKIFEEVNDKRGLGYVLNSLGSAYQLSGNNQMALYFFERALAVRGELGVLQPIATTLSNIGQVIYLLDSTRYPEALDYFGRAMVISERIYDSQGKVKCLVNMATIHNDCKNYTASLDVYKQALALSKDINYSEGIVIAYRNIASILLNQGDITEAEKNLQAALQLSRETGQRENEKNVLSTFYEVEKQRNNFEQALSYYEKYSKLKDEIANTETAREIANLKIGYELELNEKELKLTEKVLFNVLPPSIARRIKDGEEHIIERFTNASVLFADIAGFTTWSHTKDVDAIAGMLNHLFQCFDELAEKYGVEKIKTIGDAYMCVTGLPEPAEDHAERMANLALAMNEKVKEILAPELGLRIGIHTGEVIAGVLGKNKYAYDLWGDTVNTASRMESHGVPGKIQVSQSFKDLLKDKFRFEDRGDLEIKGKGKMHTWFLLPS